jgi:hypothetical protein
MVSIAAGPLFAPSSERSHNIRCALSRLCHLFTFPGEFSLLFMKTNFTLPLSPSSNVAAFMAELTGTAKPKPRFLAENRAHWRERGEQMRSLAQGIRDLRTKAAMIRLADEYDKLASAQKSAPTARD